MLTYRLQKDNVETYGTADQIVSRPFGYDGYFRSLLDFFDLEYTKRL